VPLSFLLFLSAPASPSALFTLSLHDALPICFRVALAAVLLADPAPQLVVLDEPTKSLDVDSVDQLVDALAAYEGALLVVSHDERSEEHTSELQSRFDLVCRLLLEKKKNDITQ